MLISHYKMCAATDEMMLIYRYKTSTVTDEIMLISRYKTSAITDEMLIYRYKNVFSNRGNVANVSL